MQLFADSGQPNEPDAYRSYSMHNYKKIPQLDKLGREQREAIEIVGAVLPFKVNNYVLEELIDWDNIPNDPIFRLTFPQKEMLRDNHYAALYEALHTNKNRDEINRLIHSIRLQLNPHPAGQLNYNVPRLDGEPLSGIQHKYRETILFFPKQGQTCHAYCTFCFRWPQFVGVNSWKFATKEVDTLIKYLQKHPEVTDIIFTGGDPMIMKASILATYIDALIEADLPHLQNIRIGTKVLGYWPQKFVSEKDADGLLRLFEKVVASGKHLALMAHVTHPTELSTNIAREAIRRIRNTGAEIRTQSPLLRHINDSAETWAAMWREQVRLGCVPYYMFMVRDTGAQHYFGVPLVRAWKLFSEAYKQVSGIARTVRGPSMSCLPGKVQILGVSKIREEAVLVLNMLQGRNPDWVNRPFFAKYDADAAWMDELVPAFDEDRFFFEKDMDMSIAPQNQSI